MPVWPPTLPQEPLRDGYNETRADTVIRTPPDAGPAKRRRRFTGEIKKFTVTYELTGAERATVLTFFTDTCAAGERAFDGPDPATGSPITMTFTKPPSFRALGGDLWEVTLELESVP